jgi:hypothetical protein
VCPLLLLAGVPATARHTWVRPSATASVPPDLFTVEMTWKSVEMGVLPACLRGVPGPHTQD